VLTDYRHHFICTLTAEERFEVGVVRHRAGHATEHAVGLVDHLVIEPDYPGRRTAPKLMLCGYLFNPQYGQGAFVEASCRQDKIDKWLALLPAKTAADVRRKLRGHRCPTF
jgi:hypothetical protein